MSVIIETSIGDMVVDLYTDERPRCSMNFLKLCKMKYYNFSLFHSVQKDLVAQTGDPTATGRGGESIYGFLYGEQARFFEMEVVPRILHSKKGLLSMVNNGSGMHGSQFFITLADSVDYLNNKHTVFGEVAEGLDIVDKLNNAFCDDGNRPHQDIRIYHTVVLDDPYDDPDGLVMPSKSPPPTQEMLDSDRIPCDADIDDEQGMTEEQLTEMAAEREAKANTQILEMVGDLPDQELAPPENVLFVCKLNPVTTSDDLEIIFSRFGTVVSCEVIKDQKTGESLQYAFVEFEKQENCEMAYFKMDNVLIDDRRIHVDFSQSVSKLKWKGKGKGVEIMNDGDAPKYILKDQQRKSDGYDLVYAHEELDEEVSKKDKKHKKSKRDDSQERSKGNHHNNDRDSGRNEDRRRDRYDDRDRDRNKDRRDTYNNVDRESRDKYEDMDRQRNRDRRDKYKEMDREQNRDRRDKYEDMDRERNRDRRDKYEDMDRQRSRENRDKYNERDRGRTERSREIDHKRYNESQRERKRSYSDHSDDDGSKYRSRKDMGSSRRAEDEIRKKKKSSRMESYSDDDNSTKKRNKSRNKRDQSYSDYSDDDVHVYKSKKDGNKNLKKSIRRGSSSEDDERQKEKGRHKNKKHKSEKKRGKYSDEESSSEEESRKRKQYDSDEEVRRKDKKKKRKA